MSGVGHDQLELELRQLPGVLMVGFSRRDDAVVIELGIDEDADLHPVRTEAVRLAATAVEAPVVVEIVRPSGPDDPDGHPASRMRVQLLGVTAAAGGQRVEIHLAHRGRRVSVAARPGDSVGVAGAVLDGLGELGLPVPFEPAAVHLLPDDLGGGVMVLLRHRRVDAVRRGTAGGRWLEEAVARAVLNGLNRYLQPDLAHHSDEPANVEVATVDLRRS